MANRISGREVSSANKLSRSSGLNCLESFTFFNGLGNPLQNPVRRENDGGGKDRSRQRSAAGFINSGDPGHALLHQRDLETKALRP